MSTDKERTLQMVEEQKSMRDPFQKLARKKASDAIQETLSERSNLEGMQPKSPVAESSEVLSEAPGTLRGVLESSNERNDLSDSGLAEIFGKFGLGELAENLALNDYGKLQLLLRLKDKFGESFFENPEARKVLQAFENALEGNKKEAKENYSKMISGANRTLGILLGGE